MNTFYVVVLSKATLTNTLGLSSKIPSMNITSIHFFFFFPEMLLNVLYRMHYADQYFLTFGQNALKSLNRLEAFTHRHTREEEWRENNVVDRQIGR